MDEFKLRKYGGVFVAAMALTLMLSLTTFSLFRVESEREDRAADQAIDQAGLCERQHALIEMQRLFLDEHENIRLLLAEAGVDDEPHPELLSRLNRLIEEADCVVGVDVPRPAET